MRLLTAEAAMASFCDARVRFPSSQMAMNNCSVVRSMRRTRSTLFGEAGWLDRSFLCMTASLDGDNVPRPGSAIFSNIRAKSNAIEISYQWTNSFAENIPRRTEDGGSVCGTKLPDRALYNCGMTEVAR